MHVSAGFWSPRLWDRLLRINRVLERFYSLLTEPLLPLLSRFFTRLPSSKFYFRPCYLNEIYMALGLWEPFIQSLLMDLMRRGEVLFLDIGSHVGFYVVFMSKHAPAGSMVVAVEPDRRNLRLLRLNISSNSSGEVILCPMALGNGGELCIHQAPNPLHSRAGADEQGRVVPSTSLDSLYAKLRNRIKRYRRIVVKIDVEGGEVGVIEGGIRFLKEKKPLIILETNHIEQVMSRLLRLGYRARQIYRTHYLLYSGDPSF